MKRRSTFSTGLTMALTGALVLTACGDSAESGESEDGPVELGFTWWGSQTRHDDTQAVIDLYEEMNPDVTINAEFADFEGYWQRIAVSAAGGDASDVMTFDESYLLEYAGRDALLDMSTLESLDLSEFPESSLRLGQMEDGLYGVPTGSTAMVVMANEALFNEAGVELPDDQSWTWEDYYELSAEIYENTDGEVLGSDYGHGNGVYLRTWLRSHGEDLFTDEDSSSFAFDENVAEEFFQSFLRLRDEAGAPSSSEYFENQSAPFEEQVFLAGESAMAFYYTTQLGQMRENAGDDVVLLKPPVEEGGDAESVPVPKATMYWSISSQTEHPEEAGEFVDFLANSPEAAEIMKTDRGVSLNETIQNETLPEVLDETGQDIVEFTSTNLSETAEVPLPSPPGSAELDAVITRLVGEVLGDRMSPREAGEALLSEGEALLGAE